MRNIIKYNGRLYAPLEEGGHTIQGEIVEVVSVIKGEKEPPEQIAEEIRFQVSSGGSLEYFVAEAIRQERSQPESRECCNCEYHLTKKANEEVILRDELIGRMREEFERIRHFCSDREFGCEVAEEALTLPLPASTKKMEAMQRVCEEAQEVFEANPGFKAHFYFKNLGQAVTDLEALKTFEVPREN